MDTNELIPSSTLKELDNFNVRITDSAKSMEKLLAKAQGLTTELVKSGNSFKSLSDIINKYQDLEKKVNNELTNSKKILEDKAKWQQKIIDLDSKEAQEVIKLRLEYQKNQRALKNQIKEQNAASGSIDQMRAKLNQLRQEYDGLGKDARKANNGLRNEIRSLHKEILDLESSTGRHQRNVGNYFSGMAKSALAFVGITSALSLLKNVLGDAVNKIRSFEKANVVLSGILGENKESIKDLSSSAIELGKNSKYTASQVTELQTELAKLGFAKSEIKESQKYILDFATALEASLGDAAALAGSSLRAFGEDTTETERYVSAMTVAANKSALSFEYLSTAMPIVAPVAKAFNFTVEDTLALLGNLSDSGFDASMAATSLRNIFLNLADSNGKLAKSLGHPVTNLNDLVLGFKELRAKGIDLATALELTDKRSVAAFQTFLQGADKLIPLRDSLIDVGDELQKIAEDQMDNLDGSVLSLQSSWEALMLSFSSSSGPMKTVVDGLTWIVDKLTDAVEAMGKLQESSAYRAFIEGKKEEAVVEFELKLKKGTEGQTYDLLKGEEKENFENTIKSNFGIQKEVLEKEIAELSKQQEDIQMLFNDAVEKNKKDLGGAGKFIPFYNMGMVNEESNLEKQLNNVTAKADIAKERLNALDEVYNKILKQENSSTTKGSSSPTPIDEKELKRQEKERVRQIEKEKKALQELSVFKIEQSAESYKKELSDTKLSYEERMAAVNEYENKLGESILKKRDQQLENEKLTTSQRVLIEEKAQAELNKISEEGGKYREQIVKDYVEKQQVTITNSYLERTRRFEASQEEELSILAEMLSSGAITQEEYEKRKTELTKEHAKERFDAEVESLRAILDIAELSAEERSNIEKKILDAELAYNRSINNQKIKEQEDYAKSMVDIEKKMSDERKKLINDLYKQSFELMGTIFEAHTERNMQKLEKEREDNDEWREEEIEKIEKLEESGAISKEQADARKAEVDYLAQEREEEIEQKQKQLQIDQAKREKALKLLQIGIETAQAVARIKAATSIGIMSAMAGSWITGGLPWSATIAASGASNIALTIASGATQAAIIAAQPLPAYKHGTDSHKGGPALVGDGGRSEMVIMPSGEIFKTPSVPTLMNLPKETMVLPDFQKALYAMSFTPLSRKSDEGTTIFESVKQLNESRESNKTLKLMNNNLSRGLEAVQREVIKGNNSFIRSSKLSTRKK